MPKLAVGSNQYVNTEYACTVVSLLPIALHEEKHHLLPAVFDVPKAEMGKMAILHVKEAIFYIPNPLIDEGKPGSSIRQTVSPMEVARSICQDYCCAHIGLGEDAQPGLFWVEGKLTASQVEEFYPEQLATAKRQQVNWYKNIIAMADTDWEKNRNMLAVSDLQREAARALNVQKEWVEFKTEEMNKCPYCQMAVSIEAAICSNCKNVVNRAKFDALQAKDEVAKLPFSEVK